MSIRSAVLVVAVFSMVVFTQPVQAQQQVCLAIGYAPPPVSELTAGPRTAAMGGVTSARAEASSQIIFSNPARFARGDGSARAAIGYLDWIGDVSVTTASGATSLDRDTPVTLGAGVVHARYSDAYPASEGCRGDRVSASGLSVGAAFHASSVLTWGVSVEYLEQQKPHRPVGRAIDVDGGLSYTTGFESLTLQLNGRNLLGGVNAAMGLGSFYRGGETEVNMPMTLGGGAGMNVLDLFQQTTMSSHSLWMATEVGYEADRGRMLRLGSEYSWKETLMLRAGYVFDGTEGHGSRMPYSSTIGPVGVQHAGIGLRQSFGGLQLQFDYAFAYRADYDSDHRLAASVQF